MENTYQELKPESEIFTEENQFPVCPWCGFEHYEDYWEFDESVFECENCGKDFEVKHVFRYTTMKYLGLINP